MSLCAFIETLSFLDALTSGGPPIFSQGRVAQGVEGVNDNSAIYILLVMAVNLPMVSAVVV